MQLTTWLLAVPDVTVYVGDATAGQLIPSLEPYTKKLVKGEPPSEPGVHATVISVFVDMLTDNVGPSGGAAE
jgi:hypothetical protein